MMQKSYSKAGQIKQMTRNPTSIQGRLFFLLRKWEDLASHDC